MRLPDAALSRAVLIGTAVYEDDELHDLPSVGANLDDLEQRLGDEQLGVFRGIKRVDNPRSAADVGSLLAEEAELAQDTLLVYYAGHGLVDRRGALYLGLSTTKSGRVDYTAMPYDFIRRALLDSPATNQIVILDCCFSGRALEAMSDPDSVVSGQIDIAGAYTLTSSSKNQPSHAPEGARHTAFTGEMLNLLSNGLPDGGEFITLDATYMHLVRELPARSFPRPERWGKGTAGHLALSRNPAWSAPNTRQTVIPSAEFVVVTAQLPFDLGGPADEPPQWIPRLGGLRAALRLQPPATLSEGKNAWVGWSSVADSPGMGAFDDDGLTVLPVILSQNEVRDCLEGFANATVWPLYHDAVRRPVIHRGWWDAYVKVNRRFAESTAAVAAAGASVWVHDYPLQLVPAMLRELRPDLRIGFFMDIPFPPHELFMQLPWRGETIHGLLGADVVGFHQPRSASNFQSLARTVLGLEARSGTIQVEDRLVRVAAFPGAIDSAGVNTIANSPEVLQRARQIREDLGNPKTVVLGAQRIGYVEGISDLDHILGIDNRLQALHELLVDGRLDPEELVVVELVGFVSKADSQRYLQLGGGIENTVARINGKFASFGRPVVHYLQQAMSPEELIAFYLSADVLAVTPMRDGMNLVAKEYVASRHDLDGALVLSEFSGAAAELRQGFMVNTYDLDRLKDAIHGAITVDPHERRRRMRAMRRHVMVHDSDKWTRAFLAALDSAAVTS